MLIIKFEFLFYDFFILQKHDIIKKRLDTHGNVIEERQDGIGGPKVRNAVFLQVHLLPLVFTSFFFLKFFHISLDRTELYIWAILSLMLYLTIIMCLE